MTVEELKADSDWQHAFDEAFGHGYRCQYIEDDPLDPPNPIEQVAEVIASADGENDGPDWVGIFRMTDGRFAKVFAGCDYTGWD